VAEVAAADEAAVVDEVAAVEVENQVVGDPVLPAVPVEDGAAGH